MIVQINGISFKSNTDGLFKITHMRRVYAKRINSSSMPPHDFLKSAECRLVAQYVEEYYEIKPIKGACVCKEILEFYGEHVANG